MSKVLNFLFLVADRFPTYRPDIQSLFGDQIAVKGHSVSLVTQSREPLKFSHATKWHCMDVTVTPNVEGISLFSKIKRHLLSFFNDIVCLFKGISRELDFVQIKDKFLLALIALPLCKAKQVPLYYWLSFSIPEEQIYKATNGETKYPRLLLLRGYFFSFVLYKIISKYCDHIFVQSVEMMNDFVKHSVQPSKITPVPMGVNMSDVPNSTVGNPFQYVYIGAMDRSRHLEFLLLVHLKVLQTNPEAKLFMVGSSFHEDDVVYLKNEAMRLGLSESVIFTGFVPREKAWQIVHESHICLSPMHPSPMLRTTTPTKCMEYMALGKPVVGNIEVPDMKYVLEASGGGVCVPWSVDDFASAINYLLCNPKKSSEMGANGRDWIAKNRDYSIIANDLLAVYQNLRQQTNR